MLQKNYLLFKNYLVFLKTNRIFITPSKLLFSITTTLSHFSKTMNFIKNILKKIFSNEFRARYRSAYIMFVKNTKRKNYAASGKHTELYGPLILDPHFVEMGDYTRLQPGVSIISGGGKVVIKKFSAIGAGTTIIPGGHTPTVGLPQYLSPLHINDTETTIVIEEDVWVGAQSILLSHSSIGRGAVVAAGSVITKKIPPYAVVAGTPGKIIATRFSLEQIIKHETILYPPEERMKKEDLEKLFENEYKGLRFIGTENISESDLALLKEHKNNIGIKEYE